MTVNLRNTETHDAHVSSLTGSAAGSTTIQVRVDAVDWTKVYADLDAQGWAIVPKLLTHAEAESIADLYHREQGFRSHVIMGRHGFGRGEYNTSAIPCRPSSSR